MIVTKIAATVCLVFVLIIIGWVQWDKAIYRDHYTTAPDWFQIIGGLFVMIALVAFFVMVIAWVWGA